MIKALFFDIDGTLVSFSDHKIPLSTITAIKAAKAKGVKIFIATGRPRAFINNLEEIEDCIDGYITNNGAHILCYDKEIYSNPISKQDVEILTKNAEKFNYPAIIMGKTHFGFFNYKEIVNTIFYGGLGISMDKNRKPIKEILQNEVYQITVFLSEQEEEMLLKQTSHCISGRWTQYFTDITDKNADKGKALVKVAEYLNIDINDTMAFGDGGNDIPVLIQAGIGVAMGNAKGEVKANANFVTSSVDSNGIFNALKHFNVI